MRICLVVPLLAMVLNGVLVADGSDFDDIFGPFHNGYAVTCKLGDMERIVGVTYLDEEAHVPCEVRYHKPTERPEEGYQVLWHAHNVEGYCERKADLLVNRLKGWGWQCGSPVWGKYDEGSGGHEHDGNDDGSSDDADSSANAGNAPADDCARYGGYYCD